jgi:hypothetical protein
MATITAVKPTRADHRMIARLLEITPGKFQEAADEYDRVATVFQNAGGSWEALFKGSSDEISLLRKVVKVAISKGIISKRDVT